MRAAGLFFGFFAACLMSPAEGQSPKIKSMRCDRKYTLTQQTPCTSCVLGQRVRCRIGWRKVSSSIGECRYTVKLGENTLSLQGCSYTCSKETEEKHCCPKFWGSSCYECPGGSDNECSGHGVCSDGITGNGTCICKENFGGSACQECRDEFHFGPDCKSVCQCQHGICNHGPSGDGSCTCYAGYTGEKCDQGIDVSSIHLFKPFTDKLFTRPMSQ